ncbi:MAG TPA: zinc ribbon domain-containing protein [Planctomycetota bacterium]|nr:zinc ribbon domain-containing protein [Planctomycetota bacterium]HRR78638.1 zinc ribbon domain-containing protein [Planctomycetota bacterium]HRT96911.1 zinc ribbon domain-containing protein [Planctomycetota bacterium]
MLCPKCGHDNPIQRLYCDECGAELQHDLAQVQAAVDIEIQRDKAKRTTHAIRWLVGVAFALFVIGILFRNAYKDLPANDVVPFIAAPTVELEVPPTAVTRKFGLELPAPRVAAPPRATLDAPTFKAKVLDEAFRRIAVTVQATGFKQPLTGLLVTDVVLRFTPSGEAASVPLAPCEIISLRPQANGLWEVAARSLEKPCKGTIAGAQTLDLHVVHRGPDNKLTTTAFPLRNLVEIKPIGAAQP